MTDLDGQEREALEGEEKLAAEAEMKRCEGLWAEMPIPFAIYKSFELGWKGRKHFGAALAAREEPQVKARRVLNQLMMVPDIDAVARALHEAVEEVGPDWGFGNGPGWDALSDNQKGLFKSALYRLMKDGVLAARENTERPDGPCSLCVGAIPDGEWCLACGAGKPESSAKPEPRSPILEAIRKARGDLTGAEVVESILATHPPGCDCGKHGVRDTER